MTNPVRVTGMVWYHPEDYDAIRRIMADGDKLPRTFSEWLLKAETGEQKLRSDGHTIVRAYIDPKTFADWCRSRGLDINAHARMQYANLVAYETHGTTH